MCPRIAHGHLVVDLRRISGSHGQRGTRVREQLDRLFVHVDHGKTGIVGAMVHSQNLLHGGHKRRVLLRRNTPHGFQPLILLRRQTYKRGVGAIGRSTGARTQRNAHQIPGNAGPLSPLQLPQRADDRVQNVAGRPLPGFFLSDFDERYGDWLDEPIAWQSDADLSSLTGTPIRLRFVLKDADLCAFRFAD